MRDLFRRAFVENALLKGIALAFAVITFVLVRGEKDAVTGVYVKVVYDLPADHVLVGPEPPTEARVTVRGPAPRANRLTDLELAPLRVDLRDGRTGDRPLDPAMVKLPAGLRVAAITPPSIHVSFEPRVERSVPVQPVLEGEPASGYRVVRSRATPKTVRVSGAKSVVDGVARAQTLPLAIGEARETVRAEVDLSPPPRNAEWRPARPVTVEVEVEAALAEKVLRDVPVRVTGAARMEADVEPTVADVVLRGPAQSLAEVQAGAPSLLVDAQAEDARPAGASRKRINVVGLPRGVAAEVRPESVTLLTRRRREP